MAIRRRILFIAKDLSYGGAERALIDLLSSLSVDSENDISLFLYEHKGKWINSVPERVRLLNANRNYSLNMSSVSNKLMFLRFKKVFVELVIRIVLEFVNNTKSKSWISQVLRARFSWDYDKLEGEYDLACTFLGPFDVLDYVNARVKMGWLHTDHSHLISWRWLELKMYRKADIIVHVGENALNSFLLKFPELDNKSEIIENVLDCNSIIEKSVVEPLELSNCIKIVSVGRLVRPKGFDKIPLIAKALTDLGLNFEWIIIGDGPLMKDLMLETKSLGIDQSVSFIGFDNNPYRYMRWAEYCIQPSLYEGKSIAVREALLLGCQVLVPDFEIYISHANPNYKVFNSYNFVDEVAFFVANNDLRNVKNNGRIYEEKITSITINTIYEKVV